MSQYKELADRLEAGTLFPAQWNKLVAILRSLDVQEPVAKVECLGTYYGKPFLGCVLGEGKAREGDSLYAAPVAAQPVGYTQEHFLRIPQLGGAVHSHIPSGWIKQSGALCRASSSAAAAGQADE